jgi:hypothetical protein
MLMKDVHERMIQYKATWGNNLDPQLLSDLDSGIRQAITQKLDLFWLNTNGWPATGSPSASSTSKSGTR